MSVVGLRKVLKEEKVIFGNDRCLKELRSGKLKGIFIAKNCPKETKSDLLRLAEINKIKITELDVNNDEVGMICKKPFSISVVCY